MELKAVCWPASSGIYPNGGESLRPLVVLLGIVMGSTVSIAVALLLTGVVFLLLPEYGSRLADERGSLVLACLLSVGLAAIAVTSFYGELRQRGWRFGAHAAQAAVLAVALWTYWPKK